MSLKNNDDTAKPQYLLDVDELAERLNVPKGWIYERTSRGDIPFIKVGKYVRFEWSVILDWLQEESEPSPRSGVSFK